MDVCFCVAVVCVFTVMWKLSEGREAGGRPPAPRGWVPQVLVLVLVLVLVYTVSPVLCGLVLLGCSVRLICVRRRSELLPEQNRAVLITGCDSGFGLALAQRLGHGPVSVFAGVLDVNGPGAQRLRRGASDHLRVLQLDVTDRDQVEAAHRDIGSQVGHAGLWGLVNNAGILHCPVDAELLPLAASRRCLDVNFLSAVDMCQVFLPLLRRAGGRIVNVSSLAASVPMPMFSSYAASKAALSLFSDVLRLELRPWDVSVVLIQPSGFRTNIFGTSDDIRRHRDQILAAASSEAREDYGESYISSVTGGSSRLSRDSSEDLSPVLCHALLSVRPRALYRPGQGAWLLPFLHRHCPTAVFDVVITTVTKFTDCKPAGLRRS